MLPTAVAIPVAERTEPFMVVVAVAPTSAPFTWLELAGKRPLQSAQA